MLTIFRTETFRADVEEQIGWYLDRPGLDDVMASELVERFAGALENTLEFLARVPGAGRARAARFSDLRGYRAFPVSQPFGRFRIYYRVIGSQLQAERLLEGHLREASDDR